ncbi:hypothetical protein PNP59_13840 [Halobacterium salinarum]|uniref:Small CPxCG-related zinc finger protein n=3 Tax=Halobacterium salinarum TaxID=2242 RepID=Q9HQV7_HALSA|nr:hypothetical protein [Halobacterium salinarum]AAG19404.1 hypothetical protein VNG_0987H [Halobacterium salinarum NRC-1]MBB6090087.1 hypothetical protein [Halobacterium salinarum]MDL0131989.1 hypothetical protein [Halobacterium salinarum]UEB92828.1 hypothetical protein LJ422_04025 [Halobacterium salinarum NRC-34001]CAP13678.1 small CPxCG-related zinc finger protein [Halobacterium salinarum R1]
MTNSDSDDLSPGDWNYSHDTNEDDETLSANTDTITSWGIVITAFIVGGIVSAVIIPSSNFVSFIFFGCLVASPFFFIFTESGAKWYMQKIVKSDSDQLNLTNSTPKQSRKKIVCQDCGWQNTQENNYCHDCGNELSNQ